MDLHSSTAISILIAKVVDLSYKKMTYSVYMLMVLLWYIYIYIYHVYKKWITPLINLVIKNMLN
jgi:hypothetical protein